MSETVSLLSKWYHLGGELVPVVASVGDVLGWGLVGPGGCEAPGCTLGVKNTSGMEWLIVMGVVVSSKDSMGYDS